MLDTHLDKLLDLLVNKVVFLTGPVLQCITLLIVDPFYIIVGVCLQAHVNPNAPSCWGVARAVSAGATFTWCFGLSSVFICTDERPKHHLNPAHAVTAQATPQQDCALGYT